MPSLNTIAPMTLDSDRRHGFRGRSRACGAAPRSGEWLMTRYSWSSICAAASVARPAPRPAADQRDAARRAVAPRARRGSRRISECAPSVRAGRLHALRRSAVHDGVPDDGDQEARRRDRDDRLRPVHRLRLLRGGLPYQARYKIERAASPTARRSAAEAQRFDQGRLAVSTKCTFCVDRIDAGLAKGRSRRRPRGHTGLRQFLYLQALQLRRHRGSRRATCRGSLPSTSIFACTRSSAPSPACTTSGTRRKHERPNSLSSSPRGRSPLGGRGGDISSAEPPGNRNWDWRAATNFITGGAGGGLLVVAAL